MIITVNKPQDLQALYKKAKNDATKHNIAWTGDMQQGYGSGFGFEGKYVVGADIITVTVLRKPMLASKSRIQNEIKKYVAQTN